LYLNPPSPWWFLPLVTFSEFAYILVVAAIEQRRRRRSKWTADIEPLDLRVYEYLARINSSVYINPHWNCFVEPGLRWWSMKSAICCLRLAVG
jgi:hypothetical protein